MRRKSKSGIDLAEGELEETIERDANPRVKVVTDRGNGDGKEGEDPGHDGWLESEESRNGDGNFGSKGCCCRCVLMPRRKQLVLQLRLVVARKLTGGAASKKPLEHGLVPAAEQGKAVPAPTERPEARSRALDAHPARAWAWGDMESS